MKSGHTPGSCASFVQHALNRTSGTHKRTICLHRDAASCARFSSSKRLRRKQRDWQFEISTLIACKVPNAMASCALPPFARLLSARWPLPHVDEKRLFPSVSKLSEGVASFMAFSAAARRRSLRARTMDWHAGYHRVRWQKPFNI